MAERERKSKPRKEEPAEEEKSYNWWQLGMYLVAAIGIIQVMAMVSMFLSGGSDQIPNWLFILFGATVLLTGAFWLVSWLTSRRT